MDFSPAESFLSADDQSFGSLFSSSETCSPAALSSLQDEIKNEPQTPSGDEKKPVKKRKSWGQELPVPTTNLPPRKRAKTEAEKEQRRIERVLRNRAAAQSSRERKRKEVEALEDEKRLIKDENIRLTARLADMEAERLALHRKLMAMTAEMSVFRTILGDKAPPPTEEDSTLDFTTDFTGQPTLDPTDLLAELEKNAETNAETRDVTQHPAVMLSFDLQCPSTSSPRPHWSRRPSPSTTRSTVRSSPRRSTRYSRIASPTTTLETSSSLITPTKPQTKSPSALIASSTLITMPSSSEVSSSITPSPCSSPSPCSPSLARPLVDATGALQRDCSGDSASVLLKSESRELDFRIDEADEADPADALRRCCAIIEARRGGLAKRMGVYC